MVLLFSLIIFSPLLVFSQVNNDSVSILKVDSLLQVSKELTNKDDFDKALEINFFAEKICLEKLGKNSASFGSCCYNHGYLLYLKGDYLQAQIWYLVALEIIEKTFGKEHPNYIQTEHDLAAVYMETGVYEKAELLFQNAKNNIEKTLGKKHQDYAGSLFSLAVLYYQMSDFHKAEPLFIEAKNIHETTLGKETSNYTKTIEALAALYDEMGDYERAEPLFIEAKNIWQKRVGTESSDYAIGVYNLAILYVRIGNYVKAELLMLEAKVILQKVWGEEHPDFATILDGLAQVYEAVADYGKAEPYLIQSKEIRLKTLGKEHNLYAQSLHNLGVLNFLMGNYEKSESLFLDAKNIEEKAIGKDQPDYAINLHQLADLYALNKNFAKAETLYLEAKAIREKILGREHPDYAQSLNGLTILYQNKGDYQKAEQFFVELSVLERKILQKALNHLSEKELNNYLILFSKRQDEALSFLQLSGSKIMSGTCYDNCLFYKGFLLNGSARIKRIASSEKNSAEKFNLLKSFERRLAVQYSKPIADRDSLSLNLLEIKANDLEKELALSLVGYGEELQQVNWKEIQKKLKLNEVAIEFVQYKLNENLKSEKTMYAALMVRNDDYQPKFISLFEEKQLDSLLKSSGGRKADYVNNLYSFEHRGATFIEEQPQKTLDDLLWKPLEPYLKDITTIYYSPAGLLHRLNLAAIASSEDQTLGDKYHFIQLKSTRQLVVSSEISNSVSDALLFGGIEFNLDSSMLKNNLTGDIASLSRSFNGELGFENSDTSLCSHYPVLNSGLEKKYVSKKRKGNETKTRGGSWIYLPGTEKEITIIENILLNSNTTFKSHKGFEASEEAFKKIGQNGNRSPRILHLATHGYFFPDSKSLANENQHMIDASEPVFKISDHPMLRSGLILAGGNTAWQGAKTLEGHEDGILTAYEISQMNLSNTELVVLSACETGLGDIQGNEGVYGLQRAFKIAGAKYLIMSLWQVPDKQTSELMKAFYQKWLVEKMSLPDAFRSAQKDMRERFVDPYAWAGFVLVE